MKENTSFKEKKNTYDKNGRLEWLDVLKCIVMFCVVVGHAVPKDTNDTIGYYIYSFHMPLFFAISGMTFYLQCSKRNFTIISLVKNKAKTLIWPYWVFSLIALPLWIFNFRVISDVGKGNSILKLLYGMFYSNEEFITSTTNAMWFLPTLFLTLICFWIIVKWADGNDKVLILSVCIIGCFGYTGSFYESSFDSPWHIETIPIALMCVLLGWCFIKHIDKFYSIIGAKGRQVSWIIVLLPIAYCCARFNTKISMAVNTYGSFLLFVGAFISFSCICIIISMWVPSLRILKFIGRNTVVILAFHSPFFRTLEHWSDSSLWLISQHPIMTATLVFVLLIPMCWIVEKYFPFLLGRPYGRYKKVE